MRHALNNKRGVSYVLTCVMVLVVVMLVFISIQYTLVYHVAREQRNQTQLLMDGYITRFAIENYDALKQGDAWDRYIDDSELTGGAYTEMGFRETAVPGRNEYRDLGDCFMYRPTITPLDGDSFGVTVTYEVLIPFDALGRRVATIRVPVTVISKYTER